MANFDDCCLRALKSETVVRSAYPVPANDSRLKIPSVRCALPSPPPCKYDVALTLPDMERLPARSIRVSEPMAKPTAPLPAAPCTDTGARMFAAFCV